MPKIVNTGGYPIPDKVVPSITSADTYTTEKPKPHAGGGGS
jgi:hypothetical protein